MNPIALIEVQLVTRTAVEGAGPSPRIARPAPGHRRHRRSRPRMSAG